MVRSGKTLLSETKYTVEHSEMGRTHYVQRWGDEANPGRQTLTQKHIEVEEAGLTFVASCVIVFTKQSDTTSRD
jgi:hypothetical protein